MRAAIDEARILAAGIGEETDCPALIDARRYLNWALSAVDRADIQLGLVDRSQCTAAPLGGGQCELQADHEGKHRKTMWRYDYLDAGAPPTKSGIFEWDNDSQTRLAYEQTSRFD
jgi:hypothetical protein